jgi:hypothetical protein
MVVGPSKRGQVASRLAEEVDAALRCVKGHGSLLSSGSPRGREGIDALPAVLSILGEERFVATRTADGWELKARISSGYLFDEDDGSQKAATSGNVTGVTITPVTAPAAATSATPVTPATVAPGASGAAPHS